MIDDVRKPAPEMSPENNCRRIALSDSAMAAALKEKNDAKQHGRTRSRLRRLKLFQSRNENSDERCWRKRPMENHENLEDGSEDADGGWKRIRNSTVSFSLASSQQLPAESVVAAADAAGEKFSRSGRSCASHGSIALIGRRREMEDAVAVELGFLEKGGKDYNFFGVYDGHGGSCVAHACREWLHQFLIEEVGGDEVINWEKVMTATFGKMDEEVSRRGAAVAMVGSTAVVAVLGQEELVVANCGDSRAVILRSGVAMALSHDHKPDRLDELERIEELGGKVINWNGHRVLGVLATSRSIGDNFLKPFIIAEPQVIVSERTDEDEFLILASDGLWDVVSNDVACQVVRWCLDGRIKKKSSQENIDGGRLKMVLSGEHSDSTSSDSEAAESRAMDAAAMLAELAIARGSRDNISIVVVDLRKSACNGCAV